MTRAARWVARFFVTAPDIAGRVFDTRLSCGRNTARPRKRKKACNWAARLAALHQAKHHEWETRLGISAVTPAAGAEDATTHLEFADNRLLVELCGEYDKNLTQVESQLGVQIIRRGNQLAVMGDARAEAGDVLQAMYQMLTEGRPLEHGDIAALIRLGNVEDAAPEQMEMFRAGRLEIRTRKKTITPRTEAQQAYTRALLEAELNFGISARRAPARPISRWPPPCRCSPMAMSTRSSCRAPPWKRASVWAFCPAT
jgi:hypothetical protein